MGELVKKDISLPSVELRPLPVPPAPSNYRRPAIFGIGLILAVFGGVGAWSALASLDSAAIAPGTITVESKRKAVQHMEGGIVRQILVEDGAIVRRGETLVRMDDTRVKAQLAILRGQLDAAKALAARLTAERDDAAGIDFPGELLERAGDANVRQILEGQRILFDARRASRRGEIEILQQRVGQLKEEIAGLQRQQRARSEQISLINDELKGLTELFEKGYAPKTRILALQREAARLTGERGQDIAQIARAENSIGEAQLRILQIRKDVQEKVAQELRETRDKVYDLEERLVAAKDQLDRTEVVSPVDGIVMGKTVFTEGGVVQAGNTMMYVVPNDDRLVIEAQLSVNNIDDVKLGDEVEVRLSGIVQRKVPLLFGKLTYVSPDRQADERTGMPFYTARVEVPEHELLKIKDVKLSAGMPAEVFVKTGERTPLDYMLMPLVNSINKSFREQ
ncbi:MAG: HlyD family type I secretion periplasmic adaptor subunit [Rhodospirillales bacterium]